MPMMETTRRLKFAKGEYDFAVDGGAVSTIALRATSEDELGNDIPPNAIIIGGWVEVDTLLTSGGAATVAIQAEAANDIVNAAAVSGAPWSTTGRKSVIPAFTGVTSVKTSARRSLSAVIGAFALTAGKFRVVVAYY